jgi:hypothetical protein
MVGRGLYLATVHFTWAKLGVNDSRLRSYARCCTRPVYRYVVLDARSSLEGLTLYQTQWVMRSPFTWYGGSRGVVLQYVGVYIHHFLPLLNELYLAAYVHYPTISTDMLARVRSRTAQYNNTSGVARSSVRTYAKLMYAVLLLYALGSPLMSNYSQLLQFICDGVLCEFTQSADYYGQFFLDQKSRRPYLESFIDIWNFPFR